MGDKDAEEAVEDEEVEEGDEAALGGKEEEEEEYAVADADGGADEARLPPEGI